MTNPHVTHTHCENLLALIYYTHPIIQKKYNTFLKKIFIISINLYDFFVLSVIEPYTHLKALITSTLIF